MIGAFFDLIFGGFLWFLFFVFMAIIIGGLFMVLTGQLSVGGSTGRSWKQSGEKQGRNNSSTKITRKDAKEYSDKYYR